MTIRSGDSGGGKVKIREWIMTILVAIAFLLGLASWIFSHITGKKGAHGVAKNNMAIKEYPTGIELIEQGRCPKGCTKTIACVFCMGGHSLECHYPLSCEEAQCRHLAKYGSEGHDVY